MTSFIDSEKVFKYSFFALIILFLYFSFLVLKPFLGYVVLSLILVFTFYPVYKYIKKGVFYDWIASFLTIIIILLLIVIPSISVVNKLVPQSINAYNTFTKLSANELTLPSFLSGFEGQVIDWLTQGVNKAKDYLVFSSPNILGSVASVLLGIFIMFFIMFFAFKEGDVWLRKTKELLPLSVDKKEKIFQEIKLVTKGTIYGVVMTAFIQGAIGALGFFIFGYSSPIFWGFIMAIAGFFPYMGTSLIWIPASLFHIFTNRYFSGIGLLLYGSLLVGTVDNFLKPKLIGDKARVHPVLIILGVFGGLKAFGFMGLLIGPIILALTPTLLNLLYLEEKAQESPEKA